ncbi:MAG: hypothetical protein HY868_20690 [Chloroflexi bacterium]|nr:hypothetical protein [Chloroflexota bacterium]
MNREFGIRNSAFKRLRLFLVCGLIALMFGLLAISMPAQADGNSQSAIRNPLIGNYCIECHTSTPTNALDWARPIEWARDIPCATLRKGYEEIYQTDMLVSAFQNANAEIRMVGVDTSAAEKRLNARRVTALRVFDTEFSSLPALSNAAQATRYQMQKSYAALHAARAERDRLFILIALIAATVFLLTGIFLGWRNTLKGKGAFIRARTFLPMTLLAMLVAFVIFALPIFAYSPGLPDATEEETERQAASDAATRVSDAASRLSAQAWTLAHVGAKWNMLDKTQASAALTDARQAARDKELQSDAYWGKAQAVRESAVAWNASTHDLAEFRTDTIGYAASSPWQYRAMASEWINVDKAKAIESLDLGLANVQRPTSNLQSALELRAIAVTYAQLDQAKANALIAQIGDPMIRAWGWRELRAFDKATQAAQQITANYDRAWALREIARASGNPALLNDALDAIAKLDKSDMQAYATADVAIVWASFDANKAREIAQKLDAAYPEARAYAWRGIGNALAATNATQSKDAFGVALAEAKKVSKPYTVEKLTTAILIDYARLNTSVVLDSLQQLKDPLLRDQVYRGVMPFVAAEDLDKALIVTGRITSPAIRTQAFTVIGSVASKTDKAKAAIAFKNGFALVDKLEDRAVLRDLAIAWTQLDLPAALVVVDALEDNGDKTAALQAIALEYAKTDKTKSAQVFDRALNVAKTVRVRGDSFAAARALGALGSAYASVDAARANQAFNFAVESAKRVNVKY